LLEPVPVPEVGFALGFCWVRDLRWDFF